MPFPYFPSIFPSQRFEGFLKWWYPTTIGFPTKNDYFGVFWGYHHFRKHPFGLSSNWMKPLPFITGWIPSLKSTPNGGVATPIGSELQGESLQTPHGSILSQPANELFGQRTSKVKAIKFHHKVGH